MQAGNAAAISAVSRLWTTGVGRWTRAAACAAALVVLIASTVHAQGLWVFDGRTHPELHWETLETAHFAIHFHQGLEETAARAAVIAESVYGPVTSQLKTEPGGRTSIVLSAQDEIINGYAMHTGQIFIWVNLNDFMSHFSGTEKWLRKVIAHEFQHVVLMSAIDSWISPWDLYFVPSWFIEGMAEYYTESYGLERSDASVRAMTLRDRLGDLDPHDSGFAKVLYLAREYGDSTLVKIVKHRTGAGTYSFDAAFRKATGRSVKSFEEDWRRTMSGHYYGVLAAKEGIGDIGNALRLPFARVTGVSWCPDSTRLAVVGARERGMRDRGLYIVSADSTRRMREIDHGVIDNRVSWSPEGRSLVYARYHRGSHGSLLYDLYRVDLGGSGVDVSPTGRWITRNARANDPVWSPDGHEIVFLAHPDETTNLYAMDPEGQRARPLTRFTGDVQIEAPAFSPDGQWVAFSVFDEESGPDIAVVKRDGTGFRYATRDSFYDLNPVWSGDGTRIFFTSDRGGTANLYGVGFQGDAQSAEAGMADTNTREIVQLTDVGEAIWSAGRVPRSNEIVAMTLASVDTPRVVHVAGDRRVEPASVVQNPDFIGWRTHRPEITVPSLSAADLAADTTVAVKGPRTYRAWRDVRLLGWMVLPTGSGVAGMAVVNDALGRHMVAGLGGIAYSGGDPAYQLTYINATQKPMLDFSVFSKVQLGFRMYDREPLTELLQGGAAGMTFSLNHGHDLSANHTLRLGVNLFEREPQNPGRFDHASVPPPESGKQGMLDIEYRWVKRRPHRVNGILPTQGTGLELRYQFADSNAYGDFSYHRWSADAFANRRVPLLGLTTFMRLRFDGVEGEPPAQDLVGVTRDDPFPLPTESPQEQILNGFIHGYETARLRGRPEVWLGERALWGTMEFRFPIGDGLPFNVLGISSARMSGALFTDVASVWNHGDTPAKVWHTSSGAEIKHEVTLAGGVLFVGSWGIAQYWKNWRDGDFDDAEGYFRFGLVNPF